MSVRNDDGLTIPDFLRRTGGRRMTHAEARALTSPHGRTWATVKASTVEKPKTVAGLFVDNPDAPVTVGATTKAGPRIVLAKYENLAAFAADHKATTYPVSRVICTEAETFVLVTSKPWAPAYNVVPPPKPGEKQKRAPTGRSKTAIIADLLLRPTGATRADILETTGWVSVSVTTMAASAGLILRKEKANGATVYFGSHP